MSDLFSSLLIFTVIETILSTFFFTVSNFYKNLVKWALIEIQSSVAGMTTLGKEWYYKVANFHGYHLEHHCGLRKSRSERQKVANNYGS